MRREQDARLGSYCQSTIPEHNLHSSLVFLMNSSYIVLPVEEYWGFFNIGDLSKSSRAPSGTQGFSWCSSYILQFRQHGKETDTTKIKKTKTCFRCLLIFWRILLSLKNCFCNQENQLFTRHKQLWRSKKNLTLKFCIAHHLLLAVFYLLFLRVFQEL